MKNQLAFLEHGLETFIERLFGSRMDKRAVCRALTRSFDDEMAQQQPTHRPTAPTHFSLRFHPLDYQQLIQATPDLAPYLEAHLLKLAQHYHAILVAQPEVSLHTDEAQARHSIGIKMHHSPATRTSTKQMPAVAPQDTDPTPPDAHLMRDGQTLHDLDRSVINIGRNDDNNHVVLNDSRVSRYHCQLRLRHGRYRVYDLNSTHGTYVNGQRIVEHILHSGDVLTLGSTHLVYVEEYDTQEMQAQSPSDTLKKRPLAEDGV